MIGPLRKLLRGRQAPPTPPPAIPDGERVFAIGDIHGRSDLLRALIAAIADEEQRRGPARTTIILLGDLIDRGPDSAGVLALAREWQGQRAAAGLPMHILMGNHEDMLLESLERIEVLREFVKHGGRETILSFGVTEQAYAQASWEDLQALLRAAVLGEWLDFIAGFEPMVRIGDYAFVHAGIRPGQPLNAQRDIDLRWIREPFLSSPAPHGAVVVHGHTITDAPALRANRIGLDTGAYASGELTALLIEGTGRWFLATSDTSGTITTRLRDAT